MRVERGKRAERVGVRAAVITSYSIHYTKLYDLGALRVVECWADDVPEGKVTDFGKAVQAKADESVVFSWIEWPDKETRDAAMKKMMSGEFNDERMDPEKNPMPFDGKRLIYGGFKPVVEL